MTDKERKMLEDAVRDRRRIVADFTAMEEKKIRCLQEMLDDDVDSGKVLMNCRSIALRKPMDDARFSELASRLSAEADDELLARPITRKSDEEELTAQKILAANGYADQEIVILKDESYDTALVGLTTDGRAVYSYDKMVEWYVSKNNCTDEEAMEWIDFNTLRAIPYIGAMAPIVVQMFDREA